MHRFLVDFPLRDGGRVELGESDGHHAAVVLRLKVGDPVTLLDGQGGVAEARVVLAGSRRFEVVIEALKAVPPRPYSLILAAALLKGKAWDWTLQKAAELEASLIVPLQMARCVVRVESDESGWGRRRTDWQRTVNEAAKQCGSPWITRVEKPRSLVGFLKDRSFWNSGIMASLLPDACEIEDALEMAPESRKVALLVGPEGDLSPEESDLCMDAGLIPVTLGPTVLRAETASVVGLALAGHELRRRFQRPCSDSLSIAVAEGGRSS